MAYSLPLDLEKVRVGLEAKRSAWMPYMEAADRFLDNEQAVEYMAPALRAELGEHVPALILALPLAIVDAIENRLDVEGFLFPGRSSGDEGLWETWQANDLDEQSQQGHFDAVGTARAAVMVGSRGGDGPALVTVESALDCSWLRDPATASVRAGLKSWTDGDGVGWSSLMLPDVTHTLRRSKDGWVVDESNEHGLGRVPLVPLVNRPRLKRRDGRSEFWPLIPVINAANKMGTDMMTSGEFHATPRRWIFGLKKTDFLDSKTGQPVSMWSRMIGRIWASENADAKVGQFPEADLENFRATIRMLIQIAAQLSGLPPHYFAEGGQNPASADAIRSAEAQLVKRVERKQTQFGGAWEEVARLALLIQQGRLPDGALALETVWRDASTPTVAQNADATVKLVSARGADGRPLMPTPMARRRLGWTDAELREAEHLERETRVQQIESALPLVAGLGG